MPLNVIAGKEAVRSLSLEKAPPFFLKAFLVHLDKVIEHWNIIVLFHVQGLKELPVVFLGTACPFYFQQKGYKCPSHKSASSK